MIIWSGRRALACRQSKSARPVSTRGRPRPGSPKPGPCGRRNLSHAGPGRDGCRSTLQARPVFIHKLVAVGTIEERMEVLKEKAAFAASPIDADGEPTPTMTEADTEMVLCPE